MINVTLRVLETTRQGVGKTFSKYVTRWKGKASKMVNRPNEKDKIKMIIKNLLRHRTLGFYHRLLVLLENCVIMGLELKMLSTMENWRKERASLLTRRHMGEDHPMPKHLTL